MRDYLNPERDEIYHLATDPGETTNLINRADPATRRVVEDLEAKMRQRMREIGDPVFTLAERGREDAGELIGRRTPSRPDLGTNRGHSIRSS